LRAGVTLCGTGLRLRSWRHGSVRGRRRQDAVAQRVRRKKVRIDRERRVNRFERFRTIARVYEGAGRAEM